MPVDSCSHKAQGRSTLNLRATYYFLHSLHEHLKGGANGLLLCQKKCGFG